MGSATGGAPGRVAEFDGQLHFVGNHFGEISMFQEFPKTPPRGRLQPAWNLRPAGSERDDDRGFHPAKQHVSRVSAGPELRGSVRIWNYKKRKTRQHHQPPVSQRRTRAGHHGRKDASQGSHRYCLHRGDVRWTHLRHRSDRRHGHRRVRHGDRNTAREDRCQRRNGPDSGDAAERRSSAGRNVSGRPGCHARYHLSRSTSNR